MDIVSIVVCVLAIPAAAFIYWDAVQDKKKIAAMYKL